MFRTYIGWFVQSLYIQLHAQEALFALALVDFRRFHETTHIVCVGILSVRYYFSNGGG